MTAQLSAADEQRLSTWIVAIVETFLHSPAYADQGDDRRYDDTGLALQINRTSGAWFSFSLGQGGWSALQLLRHLCSGNETETLDYAQAWLASHPGEGDQRGHDDDADEAHATRRLIHAARARDILANQVDIAGDDAADVYLNSRRLHRRPEGILGLLRDSRAGEHALTAKLSDKGRVTGVMLTHIDALKGKSVHEPVRQRFDIEPARGAIFEIKPAGAGKDMVDIVICEGLEDGISVLQLGDRPWRIVALPGVACLEHFQVARGTRVLLVADGDAPKSASARSLQRGIDHLILDCNADVRVARAALGEDANSYLTGHTSTAPLLALITAATTAQLGPAGEAERLSRLEPLDSAEQVAEVAQRLGIPIGDLRKEIARCRRRREKAEQVSKVEAEVEAAAQVIPKDPMWKDPLPPLAELLDDCLKEIKRFLWLPTEQAYYVLPLWCLHTHFVHHDKIKLPISPRLGLRSETENAGKTTALDVTEALSATAVSAASITASVIFRLVDRYRVALFVDEAENQGIRSPYSDLLAILNAGHRRSKSQIWRSEPAPDGSGSWVPTPFDVWGAMAFAYIGDLPRTLRSRCITLPLHPAPSTAELARWDDGDLGRWGALRRQLAAYAAACDSLPRVALPPAMANRLGDNWDPLFRLASKAGSGWVKRITESAKMILEIPDDPPLFIRLLLDIRAAFAELPTPRAGSKWISTRSLLSDHLLADGEAGWNEANHGRPINETWLSRKLRKHLNPPRSLIRDIEDPEDAPERPGKPLEKQRQQARGYAEMQFRGVNAAYLAAFPLSLSIPPINNPSPSSPVTRGLEPGPMVTGSEGDGLDLEGDIIERVEGAGAEVEGELRAEVVSEPPTEEDDISDLDPDVVGIIRLFRTEHPDWSLARVRNHLHIRRSVVERAWRSTTPAPVAPEEGS